MMKNGFYFKIVLLLLFICSKPGISQNVYGTLSLGGGISDAYGYQYSTKPIFIPLIPFSVNFDLSKNNRHWLYFAEGYKQKGVKYERSDMLIRHQRGFIFIDLGYKYALDYSNDLENFLFLFMGIETSYNFFGGNSKINGKKVYSFSSGRQGFRNFGAFLGIENKVERFSFSTKIYSDLTSFNPNSFNKTTKIYFLGADCTFGYVFY